MGSAVVSVAARSSGGSSSSCSEKREEEEEEELRAELRRMCSPVCACTNLHSTAPSARKVSRTPSAAASWSHSVLVQFPPATCASP